MSNGDNVIRLGEVEIKNLVATIAKMKELAGTVERSGKTVSDFTKRMHWELSPDRTSIKALVKGVGTIEVALKQVVTKSGVHFRAYDKMNKRAADVVDQATQRQIRAEKKLAEARERQRIKEAKAEQRRLREIATRARVAENSLTYRDTVNTIGRKNAVLTTQNDAAKGIFTKSVSGKTAPDIKRTVKETYKVAENGERILANVVETRVTDEAKAAKELERQEKAARNLSLQEKLAYENARERSRVYAQMAAVQKQGGRVVSEALPGKRGRKITMYGDDAIYQTTVQRYFTKETGRQAQYRYAPLTSTPILNKQQQKQASDAVKWASEQREMRLAYRELIKLMEGGAIAQREAISTKGGATGFKIAGTSAAGQVFSGEFLHMGQELIKAKIDTESYARALEKESRQKAAATRESRIAALEQRRAARQQRKDAEIAATAQRQQIQNLLQQFVPGGSLTSGYYGLKASTMNSYRRLRYGAGFQQYDVGSPGVSQHDEVIGNELVRTLSGKTRTGQRMILQLKANVDAAKVQLDGTRKIATETMQLVKSSFTPSEYAFTKLSKGVADYAKMIGKLSMIFAFHRATSALWQDMREGGEVIQDLSIKIGQIQTISQESQQTASKWQADVRDLSTTYGASLADQSEAMYQLISNQVAQGEAAYRILNAANAFALTTGSSVSDSVDVLTAVMNAYKMSANDMEHISASLFKTIDIGRVNADELANSFGQITIYGSELGVSLEELEALLAMITIRGEKSSQAMTQIRGLLMGMMKPNPALIQFFQKYGYESAQAMIAGEGFSGMLAKMGDSTKELPNEMAELIPRMRGLQAALLTTSNGGLQEFTDKVKVLTEAEVSAKNALEIMANTVGVQQKAVKQAVSNTLDLDYYEPVLRRVYAMVASGMGIQDRLIKNIEDSQKIAATEGIALAKEIKAAWGDAVKYISKETADANVAIYEAQKGITTQIEDNALRVKGSLDLISESIESLGTLKRKVLEGGPDESKTIWGLNFDSANEPAKLEMLNARITELKKTITTVNSPQAAAEAMVELRKVNEKKVDLLSDVIKAEERDENKNNKLFVKIESIKRNAEARRKQVRASPGMNTDTELRKIDADEQLAIASARSAAASQKYGRGKGVIVSREDIKETIREYNDFAKQHAESIANAVESTQLQRDKLKTIADQIVAFKPESVEAKTEEVTKALEKQLELKKEYIRLANEANISEQGQAAIIEKSSLAEKYLQESMKSAKNVEARQAMVRELDSLNTAIDSAQKMTDVQNFNLHIIPANRRGQLRDFLSTQQTPGAVSSWFTANSGIPLGFSSMFPEAAESMKQQLEFSDKIGGFLRSGDSVALERMAKEFEARFNTTTDSISGTINATRTAVMTNAVDYIGKTFGRNIGLTSLSRGGARDQFNTVQQDIAKAIAAIKTGRTVLGLSPNQSYNLFAYSGSERLKQLRQRQSDLMAKMTPEDLVKMRIEEQTTVVRDIAAILKEYVNFRKNQPTTVAPNSKPDGAADGKPGGR